MVNKLWVIVLENDYYSKKSVSNIIEKVIRLKENNFSIKVVLK